MCASGDAGLTQIPTIFRLWTDWAFSASPGLLHQHGKKKPLGVGSEGPFIINKEECSCPGTLLVTSSGSRAPHPELPQSLRSAQSGPGAHLVVLWHSLGQICVHYTASEGVAHTGG